MEDYYKLLGLLVAIALMIILGLSLVSSTGYAALDCAEFNEPYITFEPYTTYENQTVWGAFYQQILDMPNILIPSSAPVYIPRYLCAPCKYNVTFISNLPTNYFIFDEYNKDRYVQNKSAFPFEIDTSSEYTNFSFEISEKGRYYFVFDRSAQGTNRNDPATGRLIIYELKGFNQSIRLTKYREVTKYRNVTRCQ